MLHYELVKVISDGSSLAKVINDVIMWHHGPLNSIISNQGLVLTSKFSSLLCYFISIKQKVYTVFYTQTDSQNENQNYTMDAYFWAFSIVNKMIRQSFY